MSVSALSTDDEVRSLIEAEYRRGGHQHGWSYVFSTQASRAAPELVTIGLNPGGGRDDAGWDEDKHLIYPDDATCPDGSPMKNAYLHQPWGMEGRFSRLQEQIQMMRSMFFPQVRPERMLSFQLVPFRSPSWNEMPPGEHHRSLEFGLSLLDWKLANINKGTTVVTFGLSGFEWQIARWFEAETKKPEVFPVGWGSISARRYDTPKARQLVFLPHLSRYSIFGRDAFTRGNDIFGLC